MSDESRDSISVAEAARILGITEVAVRKRVERGKLAAERTPDGRLMVYLEGGASDATATDTTRDRPRPSRDERYTRSLEEQVEYLRRQLDHEQEANRENRRIIAALTSRIPELPAAAETSSPSEAPGDAERATEQPGRVEPQPAVEAADAAERAGRTPSESAMGGGRLHRSWWRRMFGGGA